MHRAHCCAKSLYPFFEAAIQQDWQQAAISHQKVIDFEQEADELKRNIRKQLPSGLFLPFARSDLLELLTRQDRLANKSKDIAGLVMGRKMHLPEKVATLHMPFLQCCINASKTACKAINELDELLETGFRGNEVKIVEEMLENLDSIEDKSDQMLAQIRQEIFSLETQLPAIEIIFLYQLVDWTGDIANHAQSIGGRLQMLIAR